MSPQVEVISGTGSWRLALEGDRSTVGRGTQNAIALTDPQVSDLHAVIEKFSAGWCVTDLGSSNGTSVNGARIWAPRRLRDGDEVRIGQTRLVFHDSQSAGATKTESGEATPQLTSREHDVLVALCRPLLARDMFTEPASTRAIADELVITQAAVKQHLVNVYDKFGIAAGDEHRRARLANEALRRGAISLADLRDPDEAV